MPSGDGHYHFHNGVNCLFEMPTSDARRILPSHLQPLEVQHERSILSVTAFDFYKGDGGAYDEAVLAILVPPRVRPGERLPKAALYPFVVGTSTEVGRQEGIDRWRLPHLMQDIEVTFKEEGERIDISVAAGGDPILDLSATSYQFGSSDLLFHTFMSDDEGNFVSHVTMEGEGYSEHEFENGSLTLYEHEMTKGLTLDEVNDYPFREQWMKTGVEKFSPLKGA